MFTGIIEETGVVESIQPGSESIKLAVRSRVCGSDMRVGDSLAVNGCCLTLARSEPLDDGHLLFFDLLLETWKRTNFQFARPGSSLNLERSLAVNGRLHGHFVTGHIDGLGRILRWEQRGQDWFLEIEAPPEVSPFLLFKGSIAVDGISLTVAGVAGSVFQIWIIPHTFNHTALRERNPGDMVNLEADLLGKYARQFILATTEQRTPASGSLADSH